jgi:basic membrane protein A
LEATVNNLRKAVVGGIAALAASTALTACGDAPDEKSGDDG